VPAPLDSFSFRHPAGLVAAPFAFAPWTLHSCPPLLYPMRLGVSASLTFLPAPLPRPSAERRPTAVSSRSSRRVPSRPCPGGTWATRRRSRRPSMAWQTRQARSRWVATAHKLQAREGGMVRRGEARFRIVADAHDECNKPWHGPVVRAARLMCQSVLKLAPFEQARPRRRPTRCRLDTQPEGWIGSNWGRGLPTGGVACRPLLRRWRDIKNSGAGLSQGGRRRAGLRCGHRMRLRLCSRAPGNFGTVNFRKVYASVCL